MANSAVLDAVTKSKQTTRFRKTTLGSFPEDWVETTINSFMPFITSGSRGWAKFYSQYGSLFVRITNMCRNNIHLDLSNVRFISLPDNDHEGARTQLHLGDLLISVTADIGIISYIDSSVSKPAYINQHIALVRMPKNATINTKFTAYFLAYGPSQQRFKSTTDQGAKAGINLQTVRDIPLVIPPTVIEQQNIAEALSDVDGLVCSLAKLIAKKRDIKQATMQQLLTGKKRLPGFEDEWKHGVLEGAIEKLLGGGTPSRANPAFWGEGIPWVTVKDFTSFNPYQTQESITQNGLRNSAANLIPVGTLIISTRMALGKAVIYKIDVAINQDLKAIYTKPEHCAHFLYYWFENNAKMIDDLGSGSTVKGISIPDLRSLPFPIISPKEQQAIAEILTEMDEEIEQLEKRLEKTKAIKQGMMQQLLTGKTRLI
ncbi:Putative type I restriction enzyme specificity protein [Poriferisphaera corsica]|uniref:Type I restriction enzyme specificity protein n=1 Tax=Poriferisphaera corsica TaxID=2528020 RepID=A0A517YPQ3_9BACT|nr:restriction endonuclease subunit S [Poriferisphaera corsica]QDU32207.1 Putative type I restriction enzyme specificity protein [Poriferisphaera corsica]